MREVGCYYHEYLKKWYVCSRDGRICREFETEEEARACIRGLTQTA